MIGQRQLQDEMRNIEVLGFCAPYIRGLTVSRVRWHHVSVGVAKLNVLSHVIPQLPFSKCWIRVFLFVLLAKIITININMTTLTRAFFNGWSDFIPYFIRLDFWGIYHFSMAVGLVNVYMNSMSVCNKYHDCQCFLFKQWQKVNQLLYNHNRHLISPLHVELWGV